MATKEKTETEGKSISERALANIPSGGISGDLTLTTGSGKKYAIARTVTRPILKLDGEDPSRKYAIRFVQAIVEPQKDDDGKVKIMHGKGGPMAAPWTGVVIDLEDDVEKDFILNATFLSALRRSYPGDSYIGKAFIFSRYKNPDGKRYMNYDIAELKEIDG